MGLILGLLVAGISFALSYFFGFGSIIVWSIIALVIAGGIYPYFWGHRGFADGKNTDLTAYMAIIFLFLALLMPAYKKYQDEQPIDPVQALE